MTDRKAIFFVSNYYDSPFQVGDHHLARAFAEDGWRIAFVSAPVSPFHLLTGLTETLRERYRNYFQGGVDDAFDPGSIWSYVPGALLVPKNVPLFRRDFVLDHWHRFTFPSLIKKLRNQGFSEVDLIYSSTWRFHGCFDLIPHRVSVFRMADRESGYSHALPREFEILKKLASRVDLLLYSAHDLAEDAAELAPKRAVYFPNGVNLSNFERRALEKPDAYQSLHGPIVVYVGAIHDWFDFDLLNELAAALPDVNFVLIGPCAENRSRFEPRENVFLLGKRDYTLIANYLFYADIGIVPFNRRDYPDLVNAINPLKLYEYMACGLPVVATRWHELEYISSPAVLCDTPEDFQKAIRDLLHSKVDPLPLIDFAREHDWSARYHDLQKEMKPLL